MLCQFHMKSTTVFHACNLITCRIIFLLFEFELIVPRVVEQLGSIRVCYFGKKKETKVKPSVKVGTKFLLLEIFQIIKYLTLR